MPYIKESRRQQIYGDDAYDYPLTAGELNFLLTKLCLHYWEGSQCDYQAYNDILGALEGCKLELYRRRIAPYEDQKIEENGDVY